MLQITEDTPPDMLAGAMDLTVHLPTGRAVKMAVERSTPMMDLLVQITTNHQLQLSNYTLQALGMAPSSEHSDKILPYKPNTPIGTLDTQHIRVVSKSRTLPVPKNIPPGHQPFESTFRLKVHLPRNQLYVTRVSRNVLLEDIMKKVCEEKNLDPLKYELKHPGNLDEVLDPKLTLSDYQITEIYVVLKGTVSLNQAFSTNDIMALRKEEERKQMHNKTGGGVFNLIFRRGKSSMGSGSISSDTRSISPTHSDDSRSVTPPAVPQQILTPPAKDPPQDRPKPPQRKRRPAPKPPNPEEENRRTTEENRRNSEEKPPSSVSEVNELQTRKAENTLTICHSRNSSDSSGYHEASVLSDNCNTSLPRRPKSAFVTNGDMDKVSKMHSQSTTNLSKMSYHSKSTTSLGIAGRKKKAAPPPPPTIRASNPAINIETPSNVVASQPASSQQESFSSQQALDSLASGTSCPSNIIEVKKEDNFFGSTDSGIAQETVEKLPEVEDSRIHTPPPPPLLDDTLPETIVPPPPLEETVKETLELVTTAKLEPTTTTTSDTKSLSDTTTVPTTETLPPKEEPSIKEPPVDNNVENLSDERLIETNTSLHVTGNGKDDEIDWHYQLPSPPKAFRDSSPLPESVHSDSQSMVDCKDSVVTSPELFEKLKSIEDNQSDKTLVSDLSSVASEEEQPLCSNLSLENLEKRKSLVYNRELSTSLKMTDNLMQMQASEETFSTSLSTFESTFVDIQQSSQKRETIEPKYIQKPITMNTLPNFKISTYDKPKQKIKVFEDDTIHSNRDNFTKVTKSVIESAVASSTPSKLNKSYFRRSMENISYRKNSFEDQLPTPKEEKEEKEYTPFHMEATPMPKSFGPMSNIFRSESFSTDSHWSPSRPVSRSKSHLALNAINYREGKLEKTGEHMSRSNSLYDVSGLQSLGVMRLIQNKLNTPTSSMENVNQHERFQKAFTKAEVTKENPLPPKPPQLEETSKPTEKVYKYRGPPSVNMGTWSDRPKVPVSVKEDADYKLGNNLSTKLIVNTTNNNITSNNTIEVVKNTNSININGYDQKSNSVSIKVNGTESVHSREKPAGNVIIKIGTLNSEKPKMIDNQRFITHTTAAGYRKPFSTINNNQTQRPHSIAFGSDFDISRVPVVRSVELKKPYKEMGNTSVTHIYQNDSYRSDTTNKPEPVSELRNRFSDLRHIDNSNNNKINEKDPKSVTRISSFKPFGAAPIVRGFKGANEPKVNVNRFSWNTSNNFSTLPVKPRDKETFHANTQVPFSQSNLRRTESNKIINEKIPVGVRSEPDSPVHSLGERNSFNSLPSVTKTEIKAPPPPPSLPKQILKKREIRPVESTIDQRDQLLSAIRKFGGKKGLKSVKV